MKTGAQAGGRATAPYIIAGGAAGSERLRVLAEATWPASEVFLREAGLGSGMKLLDAGCGNGAVTLRIAAGAGKSGRVTGLDRDPEMIRIARAEADVRGLNVEFRQCDIERDELPDDGYDLVYARLLLSHLGDPAVTLRRLLAALRPGGTLALEDVDFDGHFCHPRCPAFTRYVAWYEAAATLRGADARLGRRLLDMALDANLENPGLRVVLPTFHQGAGKQMALLTLRGIRGAVLGAGIATEAEFDEAEAEIEAFTQAPRTLMSLPRFFQVWGRRA